MRFEQFLRHSAKHLPDKTALVASGKRLTYRALDELSDQLAQGLVDRGIVRGDRVVLFLDNSAEAVVAIFAVLKAGGVFSPVNPSTKADKLAYILNNCGARGLITQQKLAAVAADAVEAAPSVALTIVADGEVAPRRLRALGRRADGAEAAPLMRRARHRHRPRDDHLHLGLDRLPEGRDDDAPEHLAAATSITTYLENTHDDVILSVLPLAFDYGLYQVLMAVKVGATLVLEKSFAFPQRDPQTLRRGAGHRLPARADHGGDAHRAAEDLEPGRASAPALRHQHRRGAAADAHRAAAGALPAARALSRCTA